ncbi:MAG: 4-hydroxy-tetrahydrodipicolinate reductase [Alphaproteobacteria bacterium]|nr:4-hydroxy-tetrahydrodipicolinate reductase [Alphaproteobacteria bacterium]MBU0796589.1 4-hydroxy-tetrahydrodipicolinate reductase [Alphaproteobacteria bacterium]MBU0886342.1 4-hydroxy-tetrahydrodipicolinate reductase [Alphaproteobacteria bacterium]MBU1813462.1 4-hydroxy-tetrahydrodipicolinate reductase [Alphaproteobacteria bacterium]
MRIGIVGAGGKMGQMLIQTVLATPGVTLGGATERAGSPLVGRDAGETAGVDTLGIAITDNADALFQSVDAVIDFTLPAVTALHAGLAARHGTAHVIGTTGLSDAEKAALRDAATKAPVVFAPNMSIGVNLLFALTQQVASILDDHFDIEIVEMHHRRKIDAPSGTALGLGEAAAAGRGVALDDVAQRARDGHTGARKAGDIGFAVLRGGDVVGDHTVVFASMGERIELTHKASSRQIYADGALRAALWTRGKAPGLYGMNDVLGLKL